MHLPFKQCPPFVQFDCWHGKPGKQLLFIMVIKESFLFLYFIAERWYQKNYLSRPWIWSLPCFIDDADFTWAEIWRNTLATPFMAPDMSHCDLSQGLPCIRHQEVSHFGSFSGNHMFWTFKITIFPQSCLFPFLLLYVQLTPTKSDPGTSLWCGSSNNLSTTKTQRGSHLCSL